MEVKRKNLPASTEIVSVRLPLGQIAMLDKVCDLTGQTRTDLIKEALQGLLYPLYTRLTSSDRGGN